MKRLAVVLLLLALPALAGTAYKGTIVATTTKNNATTASAFSLSAVSVVSVQCDAAAYLAQGAASTVTVTTGNGRKVAADEVVYFDLRSGGRYIAALAVSGTANCKVFAEF